MAQHISVLLLICSPMLPQADVRFVLKPFNTYVNQLSIVLLIISADNLVQKERDAGCCQVIVFQSRLHLIHIAAGAPLLQWLHGEYRLSSQQPLYSLSCSEQKSSRRWEKISKNHQHHCRTFTCRTLYQTNTNK